MIVPQTEVIITANGAELGRYTVTPGEYVIGREGDIPVQADLVSRRHALLTVNYGDWLIEDLRSTNGTQLNGQPVSGAMRVWPSQKIQVGAATIELHRVQTQPADGQSLSPQAASVRRYLPPEFLRGNKYAIERPIAHGGMGAILAAQEAGLRRPVAMKVMLESGGESDLVRFIEEAQITGQLQHPNIVPVYELGVDEHDQVFYTMKLVEGITLKKVLELLRAQIPASVEKYPLNTLLTIFLKVCDALAYAHAKRVIHRDLKPENLMLGSFGEVLVMDWGLAKVLRDADTLVRTTAASGQECPPHPARPAPRLRGVVLSSHDAGAASTLAGTIMGTPHFMSPEQANGKIDQLDARSDIFSLGAILYQILTLDLPFQGRTVDEVLAKVRRCEPMPPQHTAVARAKLDKAKTKPEVPSALAAVAMKALSLRPEDRYQSVTELQREIEAYQGGFATGAEKAGAWKQFTLLVKRNKALFGSAAAAAVIIAIVVGAAFQRVAGERNVAVSERNRAETALTNLAKTAPTFFALSKGLVEQGNMEGALEKLGYAVSLDGSNPDYLLQQANLLQATQKIAEAAECYRGVLALRSDAAARMNLELCEKLLRDNAGRAALKRESQGELVDAMIKQGRAVEAASLGRILGHDSDTALAAIKARMKPLLAITGPGAGVSRLPNGTFRLDLWNKPVMELPPLNGLPITEVELRETKISDLTPLKGLRLRRLSIARTPVTNLSPLAGMPLERLDASMEGAGLKGISDLTPLKGMPLTELNVWFNRGVSDLSPLRGMPLKKLAVGNTSAADLGPLAGIPIEELSITGTAVNDLSPLAGMPLTSLIVRSTKVTDLSPLKGAPLRFLSLWRTPVSDLSPLAGMPLEVLNITGTKVTDISILRTLPLKRLGVHCPVKDLSPLADCKALERLEIPKVTTDISFLRALPNLQRLTDESMPDDALDATPAAAQFWQKYDAQKAPQK